MNKIMKKSALFLPLFALITLSGCSEIMLGSHLLKKSINLPAAYSAPEVTQKRKTGNPYTIMGKTYYPLKSSDGYRQKGIASWYGKDFHGKKTANGEKYNMYAMTAAHPSLPLPTYVRVTNLNNGNSIVVRVNDRGPFVRGRLIDLSYRAAVELEMAEAGTSPVLLEALPVDGSILAQGVRQPKKIEPVVQPKLQQITPKWAAPQPATSNKIATQQVVENKYDKVANPVSGIRFTDRIYMKNMAINSEAENKPQLQIPNIEEETDLADNTELVIGKPKIFVQTGAFSSLDNAERQQNLLKEIYDNSSIAKVLIHGKTLHRVRVGPLNNIPQADKTLINLVKKGYNVARIVVD